MMKATTVLGFGVLVVSATAQGTGNLPSLAQAVQDLSPCSLSSFAGAVKSAGCVPSGVNADTFNCMCNLHLGSIVTDVARDTSGNCIDFSQTFGTMCGVYLSGPSTSDVNAGVSALQGVVDGNGGSGSSSATATSGALSSTTSAATTGASGSGTSNAATSSKMGAGAAPTMMALGGMLPAVAIAAVLM